MDKIEKARLETLYKYEILDTPHDGYFDELTTLAAKTFNVPIAIISLVDTDRIWFKSSFGIDADQISRDPGLCSSAIMQDDIYMVENAKIDPRTMSNPLVAGVLGLRFYAAAPLKTANGFNLGTFCIIDQQPKTLTAKEMSMLSQFARIVMNQMDLLLETRLIVKDISEKLNKQHLQ